MSDTPITPSTGSILLASVAASVVVATATIRTPTIGAVTLGGVAPAVVSQLQTPDTPTTIHLLQADSQSSIQKLWPGGSGIFSAVGTWGGATVTLQFAGPDGMTMVAAGTSTTLSANGCGTFNLPRGLIQAAISSASGSTSLTSAAQVLPTLIG